MQVERARSLLAKHGMMRTGELAVEVAATTMSRLLTDAPCFAYHVASISLPMQISTQITISPSSKARAERRDLPDVRLAYHQLTDQMPGKVWMAIGLKDWAPAEHGPPMTCCNPTTMGDPIHRSTFVNEIRYLVTHITLLCN
jgi:hypothetical protein